MLVKNNTVSLITIPLQGLVLATGLRPEAKRKDTVVDVATQVRRNNLVLLPGVNQVPSELWAQAAKNATIARMLTEPMPNDPKTMKIEVETGESGEAVDNTSSMQPKAALALVKDTFNIDVLASFLESEKRPNVRKAIEDQLEFVRLEDAEAAEKKPA